MKKINHLLTLFIILFPILSFGQESLEIKNCTNMEYAINDHHDSDNDGNVCEAKIVLSNSASYTNNFVCNLSDIHWTVIVDLDKDGVDDLEYSSTLPSSDITLDDTNNNGIPDLYIPTTAPDETQNIPLPDIEGAFSNHEIRWSVFDDCGLEDLCVAEFSVKDKKAPTPYCIALATASFDGIEFEIYAEDFNVGSFDNCTEMENLRYSFSGDSIVPTRWVTCEDVLNSPVEVSVYFWDENDNTDYCNTHLTVIPEPFVDCDGVGIIAGEVKSWKGEPLEGVEVILDANAADFPKSVFTDVYGEYSFGSQEDLLDYNLSASLEDNWQEGNSTLDLVLIVRHILGLQSFTSPYQIIAGDINGDHNLKASDLIAQRKLILGVITEITGNSIWKFLREDFEFPNPLDPFSSFGNMNDDPFFYEFNTIDMQGYDFIGIKTGDVNN